ELGLPREISVAPGTETTDREVPVDAHAPHVVGNSASEWFDASYVFTPLPECLPSHWRHFQSLLHLDAGHALSRPERMLAPATHLVPVGQIKSSAVTDESICRLASPLSRAIRSNSCMSAEPTPLRAACGAT